MSSDRLASGEEADARTIMGYLSLEAELTRARKDKRAVQPLLELSDPHNKRLMGSRAGEVMISPILLSHVLAQVALRRELSVILDELFTAGGAEVGFRQLDEYDLDGGVLSYEELDEEVARRGEVFLGVDLASGGGDGKFSERRLELNPSRGESWEIAAADRIVVMTRVARRTPERDPHITP